MLRGRGLPQELLQRVASLLDQSEAARFAGKGSDRSGAESLLGEVRSLLGSLERIALR